MLTDRLNDVLLSHIAHELLPPGSPAAVQAALVQLALTRSLARARIAEAPAAGG